MNKNYEISCKTLDEQIELTKRILSENKQLMSILKYIDSLNMPNYYIAAGSIFQTIWNYCDNKSLNNGIKDIDIIYYDKNNLSVDEDIKYYDLINDYCIKNDYKYEIDVSNEARMHLWKKKKFNIDVKQYSNSEDAIKKWIATIHAIGVTLDNDELKIYAPFGLSDIYSKTIRPIKHEYNTKEIYDKKAKSWSNRFDNLNIIEW